MGGVPNDWFHTRRDEQRGVEALRAGLHSHAYSRHAHETYAIGVTEAGSQSFWCRGVRHRTRPGSAILFAPLDLHDGHASTSEGVIYRMLYLDAPRLEAAARERGRLTGFRAAVADHPPLAAAILRYAREVDRDDDVLAVSEAYFSLVEALVGLAGEGRPLGERLPSTLARVRELMHEEMAERLTVEDLAEVAGLGRFQLLRGFSRRFGLPPSAYLRTIRLEAAKRRLAAGDAPADVAAAVGFVDQPHLTRLFKRAYGITPGAYRRDLGLASSPSP
ncbi:AraC family ligand binding domain-containing protein [Chelatococcus sp. GCM10030263]|uniref:AraC family transcriptional regulator n=1 Tax=Chelatococcus sp. GCM10030263 TaxID=3273387 RepID=UPI00360E11A9